MSLDKEDAVRSREGHRRSKRKGGRDTEGAKRGDEGTMHHWPGPRTCCAAGTKVLGLSRKSAGCKGNRSVGSYERMLSSFVPTAFPLRRALIPPPCRLTTRTTEGSLLAQAAPAGCFFPAPQVTKWRLQDCK